MKVEELNNGFKPIEIKLTIESEQELCNLWYRLNVTGEYVNKGTVGKLKYSCDDIADIDFLNLLHLKIGELGLKI